MWKAAPVILLLGLAACSGGESPTAPSPRLEAATVANVGTDSQATVWTEKDDYIPRELVGTLGTGWLPGETVLLTYAENPVIHPSKSYTVVADTLGNFAFGEFAPDDHHLGISFILTAVGQTSGREAQSTFTDAIVPGLTQSNSNSTVVSPGSSQITIATPNFAAMVPPAVGDLLVAQIVVSANFGAAVICTPTGWTSILRNDRSGVVVQHTFYYKVTATPVQATHVWQFKTAGNAGSCGSASNARSNTGASGGIAIYQGVDQTTPIDVAPDSSSGSSSPPYRAKAITTVTNGAQILRFFAVFKNITVTPATGRLWSVGSASSSAERTAGAFHASQATAGTTGTFDASFSSSAEWAAQTVALRMAPTGPTKLAFTTSAFTGTINQCLGLITVQAQNASNAATNVASNTTVNLATDATGSFYASGDATCTGSTITSVSIASGSNSASLRYKATSVGDGTHLLTASATGLTSATQTQNISKADQTITFPAVGPFSFGAPPFSVAATASSGLTVTFASTTPLVCTVSVTSVTIVAVGTCTIQASQPGDANYNAAPNVVQNIAIGMATQTITFNAPGPFTFGDPAFDVTASASSGLPVSFTSLTPLVCTVTGATNTAPVTILAAGTCTIRASQAGNGTYSAAPGVDRNITINKANQTITFPAVAAKTFGNAPFAVSATASSSLPVTLTSLTLPVCTISGSTVTIVTAGTCTIEATQGGDDNYNPALPVERDITINKADQTISFPAVGPFTFGDPPFSVAATASPSGLTVMFSSQTLSVCTVSGTSVTIVAVGTCTIRASQGGNTNFNPAPDVDRNITINKADQTITFGPLGPKNYGDAAFGVSASATSGLTVMFGSQTTSVCTVSGTTVTIVSEGTCTIRASQPGDGTYNPAPVVDRSFTITNAAPVVTSITTPAAPVMLGSPVNVSALFTDPGYPGDSYTSSVVWSNADGSFTSNPTPTYNGSTGGSLSATRSDLPAGVYLVTVTVTDKFGLSGSRTHSEYVVVYDPSGGFVTGGGWINSPLEAYRNDLNLTGKANFGFVSKYKKGATIPEGSTEFQFHAGGMNFHSNTYQWLVVNQGGTNAQFKGTGTINGAGSYTFMIWATDGGNTGDKFRILITDNSISDPVLAVVYDNGGSGGSEQLISGGSIVIHTGGKK